MICDRPLHAPSLFLRKKMRRFLLYLSFLIPALSIFAQGPITGFMPGAGVTDIAPGYSYESFNKYYFGKELRTATNTLQTVNLFVEHGFSDSLSIVLNLPYIWNAEGLGSLQDATIALKYRNMHRQYSRGSFSLIGSAGITFPAAAYSLEAPNPIGIRATTLQARVVGQYNSNYGWFVHAQSGYELRILPDVLQAVPVLLRAGFGAKRYYVEGWVEWFNTLGDGADDRVNAGRGSDWLRAGGVLYVPITPGFGIFGGGAYIFTGRNIGQATRLNTGVVWKLRSKRLDG